MNACVDEWLNDRVMAQALLTRSQLRPPTVDLLALVDADTYCLMAGRQVSESVAERTKE